MIIVYESRKYSNIGQFILKIFPESRKMARICEKIKQQKKKKEKIHNLEQRSFVDLHSNWHRLNIYISYTLNRHN